MVPILIVLALLFAVVWYHLCTCEQKKNMIGGADLNEDVDDLPESDPSTPVWIPITISAVLACACICGCLVVLVIVMRRRRKRVRARGQLSNIGYGDMETEDISSSGKIHQPPIFKNPNSPYDIIPSDADLKRMAASRNYSSGPPSRGSIYTAPPARSNQEYSFMPKNLGNSGGYDRVSAIDPISFPASETIYDRVGPKKGLSLAEMGINSSAYGRVPNSVFK